MANNFRMDFDASDFISKMKRMDKKVQKAADQAGHDIVDELVRIASEITPIDKGILQRSYTTKMRFSGGEFTGEVKFSVKEGDFDYSVWIHEGVYNNGEQTMKRPGTTGWSGKKYAAGRKYLERPLKGEHDAFLRHIAKEVKKATGAK